MKDDITMPDFDRWAVSLWQNNGPKCTKVKEALQQAFEQGRALGRREATEIGDTPEVEEKHLGYKGVF